MRVDKRNKHGWVSVLVKKKGQREVPATTKIIRWDVSLLLSAWSGWVAWLAWLAWVACKESHTCPTWREMTSRMMNSSKERVVVVVVAVV